MTIQPKTDLFRQLPAPPNLFQGSNLPSQRVPEEVLVFFRGNPQDAMACGDIAQHHRFVLCFCFKTRGSVQIDAEIFNLHPREGCLVFPYQPHHFTHFKNNRIAWLFISFEMKDSGWLEPLRNTVFSINDNAVQQLNRMAENRVGQQGEMLPPQLVLLLGHFLNSTSTDRQATASQVSNPPSHLHANLSTVLGFIHQNLNSPIKVSDVVAASGCSETVLREQFENSLNMSIAAYIRKMRILRACHLLATSRETIGSISDRCGFSSQYAFSRTFKHQIGHSPSTYRNDSIRKTVVG